MNIEPTYKWYQEVYKGTLSEEVFTENLTGAIAHVNWLIALNEVTEETVIPYKRAVCAVAEVFGTMGHNGTDGGFSIGSFSVGGWGSSSKTSEEYATDAAVKELALCGLLFQGVC